MEAEKKEKISIAEAFAEVERKYTLRRFNDGDLLPLLRILRKLGLKSFKSAFKQFSEGKNVKEVGVDVVLDMADIMIDALDTQHAAEEIYNLYSGLSGIPAEDIKKMEFGTLPMMIYDSFREAADTSFFRVLTKLL